jgi:hypothetical protein
MWSLIWLEIVVDASICYTGQQWNNSYIESDGDG